MPTDTPTPLMEAMFRGLRPDQVFPKRGTLLEKLELLVKDKLGAERIEVGGDLLPLFATAATEMWHRAIHSFLVSVCLTETSPLWASVSGYYSSHYTIRAIAHLLGFFRLLKTYAVRIEYNQDQLLCYMEKPGQDHPEHQFYWKRVKAHQPFSSDPLMTNNEKYKHSDVDHRNTANYADHINHFPEIRFLDETALQQRIGRFSQIEVSAVNIPNHTKYPDVVNVQLIAYYRLIRFRRYVDEAIDPFHPFWTIHRVPAWCSQFMDFQIIDRSDMAMCRERP
jgi:hypothetical protein